VAAHLKAGALQTVLEDFEAAPLPVHVEHHEGRRATQKVRSFIDLAVETLRADPALNRRLAVACRAGQSPPRRGASQPVGAGTPGRCNPCKARQ
jgi:hypothetical protein